MYRQIMLATISRFRIATAASSCRNNSNKLNISVCVKHFVLRSTGHDILRLSNSGHHLLRRDHRVIPTLCHFTEALRAYLSWTQLWI